jgi:hypothetical protein
MFDTLFALQTRSSSGIHLQSIGATIVKNFDGKQGETSHRGITRQMLDLPEIKVKI